MKEFRFSKSFIMGKLIVVSNRLPVTIEQTNAGFLYKRSSGGLVSALGSLTDSLEFIWIGWPGITVDGAHATEMKIELHKRFNCVPVFLPEEVASGYYNGFANG